MKGSGVSNFSLIWSGKTELLEHIFLCLNLLNALLWDHGLDHIKFDKLLIEVAQIDIRLNVWLEGWLNLFL
jgi:hypothetical protein